MKLTNQNIPKIIWLVLLLALSFFAVKQKVSPKDTWPLKGAYERADFPKWVTKEWFDGNYQKKMDKAAKQNFGFRSLFVRTHNEIDYRVFKKINTRNIVEGEDKSFFNQTYIDSYHGVSYERRKTKLSKIKKAVVAVGNEFKDRGKEIVYIVMPGKSFVYPEKMPLKDQGPIAEKTIYKYFMNWAEEEDLSVIDFQKYFIDQKENIDPPIFPNLGTHLSVYAETIVLDSLLNYIEAYTGQDLYHYHFTEPKTTTKPRGRDHDIGSALNLLKPVESEPLTYRYFRMDSIRKEAVPNILVVGDSFYWGMVGIVGKSGLFGDHEFWYRNHAIFNGIKKNKSYSNKEKCIASLDQFDMVFIVATSCDLDHIGWDYFEKIYWGLDLKYKD